MDENELLHDIAQLTVTLTDLCNEYYSDIMYYVNDEDTREGIISNMSVYLKYAEKIEQKYGDIFDE